VMRLPALPAFSRFSRSHVRQPSQVTCAKLLVVCRWNRSLPIGSSDQPQTVSRASSQKCCWFSGLDFDMGISTPELNSGAPWRSIGA
jgi:hypothetical protein